MIFTSYHRPCTCIYHIYRELKCLTDLTHCPLCIDSSRLWSVGLEGSEEEGEELGEKEEKGSAPLALLNHLSTYFSLFHDTFIDLMTEVNLTGYTPFMTAVACKVRLF